MNKKIVFFTLIIALSLPALAFAQLQPYAPGAPQIGSVGSILAGVLQAIWIIFGAIAVFCFVLSGILFLTALGDPAKLTTARHSLYWGFAGVIVGIIAFSIIGIVEQFIR